MSDAVDVVVVGSGPNGLAAAVTCARAGLSVVVLEANDTVGGGARTVDLGLMSGMRHDLCSAVHPMAVASPFFVEFDLAARGVVLHEPEVQYAQPLDARRAAVAYRSLDRTARELGGDDGAWRALMEPLASRPDAVIAAALSDKRSLPAHLLSRAWGMASFGAAVVEQGSPLWNARFHGDAAPALLTGVASHAISPLPSFAGAGTALMLGALAHSHGWVIPQGGSQVIVDALVADLVAHGGRVVTGCRVVERGDLPRARSVVFDTTPHAALSIVGDAVPARLRRALERFRYGNAAAKVDFVVSEPIPWGDSRMRGAGTVHVGGTRGEMVAAEAAVDRGVVPASPMVLVSDPAVADPSRVVAGHRPVWSYAHVPRDSEVDPTDLVIAQIERFAPGFRDTIVASQAIPASQMSAHNANYVGGDIAAGAATMWQIIARPSLSRDPYSLGVARMWLCSSSTPPGPGVHGLGGWFAAQRVLAQDFGVMTPPSLAPSR